MANDKKFMVKNGLIAADLTYPTTDGAANQALVTDGAGNLTFGDASAGVLTFTVKNRTGGTLTKGTVVYVSGLNGNTPEVSPAQANSSSTMPAFGLIASDILNDDDGTVDTFGSLRGLNVSNFGETGITFALGDTLYVSAAEAGKLTNVAPTGESNSIQNIGKIERATPTSNMTIKVGGAGRTNATPALNEGNIFIGDSSDRSSTVTLDTSIVPENGNLYYTTGRHDSDFDVRLAIKTTDDLTEGSNQYYTTARHDSDFDVRIAIKTTDDLTEGSNQYYTTARANTAIDARVTKTFVDNLNVDADTLGGEAGSYYLNYNNFTNTPSIPATGVDFDPVGTDNSTDVTLAGSYDYLTISGQEITLGQIDASTDITGLATVATTGAYSDLTGTPTIPTNNNQLTNGAGYATELYVDSNISVAIDDLVGGAPGALDTLNELAAAINDDSAFSSTVTVALGNRLRVDINNQNLTGTQKTNAATNLGLATVATSGAYSDLTGTPTGVSTFTNDANYLDSNTVTGVINSAYIQANQTTYDVSAIITADVDAAFINALTIDADTLGGQSGSYYLNYNNFSNTPSIPATGVDFDPVGTDNSTDVTLAGSYDYLTLSGQEITLGQIDASTDITGLATVATSGSYNDLSNTPTIPTNNNQLTNGAGYTTNVGDITGVTAGAGLSGGGASGSVTLNVDLSELTDMTAAMVGTDEFIVLDAGADRRKAANEIGLSIFSNDAGFTTNVGDITGVTAGSGITGGGTSGTVTINHADTSSQASVNNSGRTYIQDITLDTYGHITGITSATETVVNTDTTYSAGGGLSLSGTTFSHTDTSSQASVNNSGATVIQDVTLDTYGHVTGLASKAMTLADLGYTGATNANYITNNNQLTNGAGYTTNVGDITGVTAGSGISGGGTSGTVTVSHADTSSQSSVDNSGATVIQDVTLDTYGHVTALGSHTLTLANLGYTGATNANYITNNNQLTNGAGYITSNQTITLSGDLSGSGTTSINAQIAANSVGITELNVTDGTSGQVLTTNGSGTLSFADAAGGGGGGEFTLTGSGGTIHSSEASNGGTGTHNFFAGQNAGKCNTVGSNNNFIGCSAGQYNTTGGYNNFFGERAGYCNTTGYGNTFIGRWAGFNNTDGSYNFIGGYDAGSSNTTGSHNNIFGYRAGYYNSTGSYNNIFGCYGGYYNTTGSNNNFFGDCAGYNNTTGRGNNFFGDYAGESNTAGRCNNFFGSSAGGNNTLGIFNNFFGRRTGKYNTTGHFNNFVGSYGGYLNTTGCHNNFFGSNAGYYNTTGSCNTFIGYCSGRCNTTGSRNVYLGSFQGTGFILCSNYIHFGDGAGNHRGMFDNTGDFHSDGDVIAYSTSVSDERLKKDISTVTNALSKIRQINGVEFTMKDDESRRAGVIAQEVEKVFPIAVTEKKLMSNETYKTVRYDALHALLIEAVKELADAVEKLSENK